jgi:HAE1 family hydrophobic/amphiphilic exporter-1
LGIVLTGGLAFSTLLTPTVVPALMGLLYDLSGRKPLKQFSPEVLEQAIETNGNGNGRANAYPDTKGIEKL